jgi:predicted nucleic acid-binding protein
LTVVIDTSTYLQVDLLRPILSCALLGVLRVVWSPAIQREIANVVYRERIARFIRDRPSAESATLARDARAEFDRMAIEIETQFLAAERVFSFAPAPHQVAPALLSAVLDPGDRPVLAAALASGAAIILSNDQRHLRHGSDFHGVECWHPDTFLTVLFQQNPQAYRQVTQAIDSIKSTIQRLLP